MDRSITRVFLVRHGATVLTAEDRFAGSVDVPLSDEGREQARRLALRLRTQGIVAVYASPLGRTLETAQILAAPFGWRCSGALPCAKYRMAGGKR